MLMKLHFGLNKLGLKIKHNICSYIFTHNKLLEQVFWEREPYKRFPKSFDKILLETCDYL
jgi:hypothetical protein